MESLKCHITGCCREARWDRVSTAASELLQHLCTDHFRELDRADWIAASFYSPLSIIRVNHSEETTNASGVASNEAACSRAGS
jgi:hypothetical protein